MKICNNLKWLEMIRNTLIKIESVPEKLELGQLPYVGSFLGVDQQAVWDKLLCLLWKWKIVLGLAWGLGVIDGFELMVYLFDDICGIRGQVVLDEICQGEVVGVVSVSLVQGSVEKLEDEAADYPDVFVDCW